MKFKELIRNLLFDRSKGREIKRMILVDGGNLVMFICYYVCLFLILIRIYLMVLIGYENWFLLMCYVYF